MAAPDPDRVYDRLIGDDDSWYEPTGPFPWQREYWRRVLLIPWNRW